MTTRLASCLLAALLLTALLIGGVLWTVFLAVSVFIAIGLILETLYQEHQEDNAALLARHRDLDGRISWEYRRDDRDGEGA